MSMPGDAGEELPLLFDQGKGVRVVGRLRSRSLNDKDGAFRERIFVVAEHVEFRRGNRSGTQTLLWVRRGTMRRKRNHSRPLMTGCPLFGEGVMS